MPGLAGKKSPMDSSKSCVLYLPGKRIHFSKRGGMESQDSPAQNSVRYMHCTVFSLKLALNTVPLCKCLYSVHAIDKNQFLSMRDSYLSVCTTN